MCASIIYAWRPSPELQVNIGTEYYRWVQLIFRNYIARLISGLLPAIQHFAATGGVTFTYPTICVNETLLLLPLPITTGVSSQQGRFLGSTLRESVAFSLMSLQKRSILAANHCPYKALCRHPVVTLPTRTTNGRTMLMKSECLMPATFIIHPSFLKCTNTCQEDVRCPCSRSLYRRQHLLLNIALTLQTNIP